MTWNGEARTYVLTIPGWALARVPQTRRGRPSAAPGRFDPVLDGRDPLVGAWIELLRGFDEFLASPSSRHSPLGVRHFEQLLIDGLLRSQHHSQQGKLTTR
ncbi:hypothetical protein [Kitasatospora sp. NPDC059827]|uniref:AraC-like ligand-binding domain-containing protein n=1 Tax=Kitasatospora sp. NPDC059827 TaxID=3346964 RepID=UPI003665FC56